MIPRRAPPLGLSGTVHFCKLAPRAPEKDYGQLPVRDRQQTATILLVTCMKGPSLSCVAVNPIDDRFRQDRHCRWRFR